MKVAMIETGGWGGFAHYTWQLCQALAEQEAEVTLLTNVRYELREHPARFSSQLCLDGRMGYPRNVSRLCRWLWRTQPDVVHLQSLLSTRFDPVLWATVGAVLPVIVTLHNVQTREESDHHNAAYWRCCRTAAAVIVHTQESLQEARRRLGPAARIEVIHQGDYGLLTGRHAHGRASARRLLGLPLDSPLMLAFGAIRPYKGIHGLLAALPRIRERHPTAILVVAGPLLFGTEAEYRDAITAARLDQAVIFRPSYIPSEQVAEYFAAADVAVYNYSAITDSAALRIACSLGTPVVATAVGAFAEFLRDGHTARLVPPDDTPALAEALADVLSDPAGAAGRAKAARELAARQWSWQSSARETLTLYQGLRRRASFKGHSRHERDRA